MHGKEKKEGKRKLDEIGAQSSVWMGKERGRLEGGGVKEGREGVWREGGLGHMEQRRREGGWAKELKKERGRLEGRG